MGFTRKTKSMLKISRESLRSEAFTVLKPFCVQLTREHTRENIAKLFTALQSVDIVFLQDLQEYVIFPLRIILKQPKKCSQDLYLDVYTCMEYVLGHTRVTRWDLFQDIFHTATTMLSCPTDQTKVARLSEELKLAMIQTLRTLVKNSDCSVVQQLYTILCLPLLGHSVSLLLNIAEMERARNLRILAMECLLDFSQADSKLSHCMKADIGNIYASFLPGISVTLCNIITGDTKQGIVITKAIYVWMRIVSLVMDDKLLETYRQKQTNKQHDQTKGVDECLAGLVVKRDAAWITSASGNLCVLVKQVANMRGHGNWRVRLGLVECAEHLLLHCTSSLTECVPQFLEILVALIADEYSAVACGSRRALDLFTASQACDQQHRLTEILEENLDKLTTALPRQIQTAEDDDKMSLLNLLSGYISLLGGRVKHLLLSQSHMKQLSTALLQVLELECSDLKVIEERTTITGSSAISSAQASSIVPPRKYFKHFTNPKIFEKVRGVCHLLGYYGDIHVLVDHFLSIFQESNLFRLQATLVINEIMLGTTGETGGLTNSKNGRRWLKHSKDELDTVIRMLINEYLSPVNFDLVTSLTQSREGVQSIEQRLRGMAVSSTSLVSREGISAAKMNRNIVQIALFMEGFGYFSKVLKCGFEPLLMLVLYPMLEKLGDETAYISNTAFIALWDICISCRYKSLDNMIRENSDYLMTAISLRLRHLDRYRRCPLVLKVMLQYSSAELLPLIGDTLKEILDSLDDNYAEEAVLFMGVLNELAKAVVRWFPSTTSCKPETKNPCCCSGTNNTQSSGPSNPVPYLGSQLGGLSKQAAGSSVKDTDLNNSCSADRRGGHSESTVENRVNGGLINKGDNPVDSITVSKGANNVSIESLSSESNDDNDPSRTKESNGQKHTCTENGWLSDTGQRKSIMLPNLLKRSQNRQNKSENASLHSATSAMEVEDSPVSEVVSGSPLPCQRCSHRGRSSSSVSEELVRYFSNLLQLEREAEGEATEEELNDFNPDTSSPEDDPNSYAGEEPEPKKVVPAHVSAVSEVMMRCRHIVASRNPRLRLLVLDTLAYTCVALQPHQDELLPLIHKVWPAFSLCFSDDEKLVIIKAIDVLQTVARCSGDFVKHRITKDVLPKLASFLQSQAQISVHVGSSYQFTVNYKLQLAILRHIGNIAQQAEIQGSDLDKIATACLLYLHEKQPVSLQQASFECCRQLEEMDGDLIWLKLCSLYTPQTYLAPDNRFIQHPALLHSSSKNDYTKNVVALMTRGTPL